MNNRTRVAVEPLLSQMIAPVEIENALYKFLKNITPPEESLKNILLQKVIVVNTVQPAEISAYNNNIVNILVAKYGEDNVNAIFYPNNEISTVMYGETGLNEKLIQVVILDFLTGVNSLYRMSRYITGIAHKLLTIKNNGYLVIILNLGTLYRIPPIITSMVDIYLFKNLPIDASEYNRIRKLIYEEGLEELRKIELEKIRDPICITKAVYRDRVNPIGLIDLKTTKPSNIKTYKRNPRPTRWGEIFIYRFSS